MQKREQSVLSITVDLKMLYLPAVPILQRENPRFEYIDFPELKRAHSTPRERQGCVLRLILWNEECDRTSSFEKISAYGVTVYWWYPRRLGLVIITAIIDCVLFWRNFILTIRNLFTSSFWCEWCFCVFMQFHFMVVFASDPVPWNCLLRTLSESATESSQSVSHAYLGHNFDEFYSLSTRESFKHTYCTRTIIFTTQRLRLRFWDTNEKSFFFRRQGDGWLMTARTSNKKYLRTVQKI